MNITSQAEEETQRDPGIWYALVATFTVYLLTVPGLSLTAEYLPFLREFGSGVLIYLIRIALLAAAVLVFYPGRDERVPVFLGLRRRWKRPLLAGVLAALPFVVCWLLGSVLLDIPIRWHQDSLAMAAVAVLGPGLFEEGLFRGLLFHRVLARTSWFRAALVTGLFFGPAHAANLLVGQNLQEITISVVAGFVMSFPLGYLFYRTGRNLWGCIGLHVLIAGSMDVFIVEEQIRAHLDAIATVTSIGLLLSLASVFLILQIRPLQGEKDRNGYASL
jgi:membrane protease YdiL (CAAX protease family)